MAVSVSLDGRDVPADEGMSLLELARRESIAIPTLCDLSGHPNGTCRLCMVELDGASRAVPACSTAVREGMIVRTDTPHLRELRRGLLALLMESHAGHGGPHECQLDRYAEEYGVARGEPSRRSHAVDSSHPAILFDPDLCILCRRCVLACDLEQMNEVIALESRGPGTRISFDSGCTLGESTCTSCGACVDVCPTDALQEKEWQRADRTVVTTCPYCGVGCTVEYGVARDEIVWARGVRGNTVNDGLLCVKGKFAFQHERSDDRLQRPLIRRDGIPRGPLRGRSKAEVFREASWNEALDLVALKIREVAAKHGPRAIGGIASDRSTNEDVYIFQRFMRTVLGTDNVDQSATLCHAPSASMLSWALGAGASTNPAADLKNARTILLVGSSTERAHPVMGAYVKRAARAGAHLVLVDPRKLEIARHAELTLNLRPGTDVVLFSAMARYVLEMGWEDRRFIEERTEGFEEWARSLEPFTIDFAAQTTGLSSAQIIRATALYATEKPSTIFWTLGITEHKQGSDNVSALVNLALVTGNVGREGAGLNPLRGQNNVQGGADMGSTPGSLPGYQGFQNPEVRARFEAAWGAPLPASVGWKSTEMVPAASRGLLRLLYISGENSIRSHPDSQRVAEAFTKLDFLVVQDLFLTETAEYADVVLPAASSFEKPGTFTNTERRVQLVRPVFSPPGQARSDWEIYADLAARLGRPMPFTSSDQIMEEIASLVPSYAGIAHDRLQRGGLQWPIKAESSQGTAILHVGAFARGRARFRIVEWRPPEASPDYPYVLITGRQREQYHTGTMTRRSPLITAVTEGPVVEMNTEDMTREGLADGDLARIVSPQGSVQARVKASPSLAMGALFTTFHYAELPANILTTSTLDPITKTPAYKDTRVRVEKISPRNAERGS